MGLSDPPARPTLVAATKLDAANSANLNTPKQLNDYARRRKLPFFAISAVTGEGPLHFQTSSNTP